MATAYAIHPEATRKWVEEAAGGRVHECHVRGHESGPVPGIFLPKGTELGSGVQAGLPDSNQAVEER